MSVLTYDTADDIITSLEMIDKITIVNQRIIYFKRTKCRKPDDRQGLLDLEIKASP